MRPYLSKYIYRCSKIFIILLFSVAGCVRNPAQPPREKPSNASTGIYVLNEGLFGRDNSSMTFYDRSTGIAQQNYFQLVNPGLRLGDTANSMFVYAGRGYIVMNGSNTIEIIEMATAKSLGRILLSGNPSPRYAVVLNDTLGFVTALYTDEVLVFDPSTRNILGRIPVGPAPEGIVAVGGRLVVANSGLGDIRADETGAGAVSIIDIASRAEIARIPVLRNCAEVSIAPDSLVYVACTGSFSQDVVTGIVVIDAKQPAVLDTIFVKHHPRELALASNGFGYVITDSALVKFSWRARQVIDPYFIRRESIETDAWLYALGLNDPESEIYLSNARNFTTNGEVVCFDLYGNEKFRFPAKLNPGTIVFR